MKYIWDFIDAQNFSVKTKYILSLLLLSLASALAGILIWFVSRTFTGLTSIDWAICFAGYPALFAWFRFTFYACNHDFHD